MKVSSRLGFMPYVFGALLLMGSPRSPAAPAAAQAVAPLGSTFFIWEDLASRPTANGSRREVTNRPTATLVSLESHVTTLRPGMLSHAPHRHAREEFIILKEGTLEVSINGDLQRAGPGTLLFFASNDAHNVKNIGDDPATYLVFNLETSATALAPAGGAAAAAKPGVQGSAVFPWEKSQAEKSPAGSRRGFVDAPTTTCMNLKIHAVTLDVGQVPGARWRHPGEELIVVKDGTVTVTLNGRAQPLGPGSIFFCAANDEHGMQNTGSSPATYYSIQVITELTAPAAPASTIP